MSIDLVASFDVGGTTIAGAAFSLEHPTEPITRIEYPVTGDFELDFKHIVNFVQNLTGRITGIGIAVPGILNDDRTDITKAANLSHWVGRKIVDRLTDEFGVRVVLGNDLEAQALGEAYYGHGQQYRKIDLVGWGSGIGFATVSKIAGQPLVEPGELGHTEVDHSGTFLCNCEQFGCLEYFAGGNSIAERYKKQASDMSDPQWSVVLNYMAIALKNTLTSAPIDLVVFTGSVALNNPQRIEQLRQLVVDRTTFQKIPPFQLSALGSDAGTIGAAALLNQL